MEAGLHGVEEATPSPPPVSTRAEGGEGVEFHPSTTQKVAGWNSTLLPTLCNGGHPPSQMTERAEQLHLILRGIGETPPPYAGGYKGGRPPFAHLVEERKTHPCAETWRGWVSTPIALQRGTSEVGGRGGSPTFPL